MIQNIPLQANNIIKTIIVKTQPILPYLTSYAAPKGLKTQNETPKSNPKPY